MLKGISVLVCETKADYDQVFELMNSGK